jgi:MoxR-like ATPase
MPQTDDILAERFRAGDDTAYRNLGSALGDRRDGQVYVHDQPLRLAVRVAIATGRPLLLRGSAGSGKSSLAPFVARMYERRFYKATVTARTEARDLMWYFDALKRLNDAQIVRQGDDARAQRVDRIEHYIEPRALWWAFDHELAERRGADAADADTIERVADPGIGKRRNGVVVLIDEIDKADPDVPNNLLESLGSLQFTVTETSREVRANPKNPPLVIITTNDERELPAAFYRRCVVHVLPEHTPERLAEIAGWHFGGRTDGDPVTVTTTLRHPDTMTLYAAVAAELKTFRDDARRLHTRRPSTAEYLDAVRACLELNIDTGHADWKDVARLTLTKPAPDPNA